MDDQFSFEPMESRATFVAGQDVWALRFPTPRAFDTFLQRFNAALFENRFGEDHSKADKVRSSAGDCKLHAADWTGQEGLACCKRRRQLRPCLAAARPPWWPFVGTE